MKSDLGHTGKNGAQSRKRRRPGTSSNSTSKAGGSHQKPKDHEAIYVKAATYCLRHFPTLWTVGSVSEEKHHAKRTWRITVVLRYPTGHEGEIGELVFDGNGFTCMTPRSVMEERAEKLAADPALQKAWNEHTRSSLPAKKP